MIKGLVQLLIFQGLGELLAHFVLKGMPGPVIGLCLLLLFLVIKGKISEPLAFVADGFSQHLGLLFIPAAVGVVLYLPLLKANWWALLLTLSLSVVATIAVSALTLNWLSRRQ